jgi:hypothetical protein
MQAMTVTRDGWATALQRNQWRPGLRPRFFYRWVIACCLLLALGDSFATDAPTTDFTVDSLARLLTREQASTVRFHEYQYRQILSQPLERSGELEFIPPDTFIRRVLKPKPEEYRLEGATLVMRIGSKERRISTRNQPLMQGLLLSFQAVVSGRLALLDSYYQSQLSGTPQQWQLTLQPTDAALASHVDHVIIDGRESNPVRFEIVERNGDRTVTDIAL